MAIPLTQQISLSPSSYSASGQAITASVSVLNRPDYQGKPRHLVNEIHAEVHES